MEYKYGIFDFDGTIIDTMPTHTKIFSELLNKKFKIPIEDSREYYVNSTGTLIETQLQAMLRSNDIPLDNTTELINEFFEMVNKKEFLLFEKAEDIIKHLYNKNIILFISTGSGTENVEKKLKELDLVKYFSMILGSNEIPKGPEHIKEFTEFTNLPVEEFTKQTFFCGDGALDMEIAKMFGIYAIGIAQTVEKEDLLEAGADIVVDKIGDILKLNALKEIN